MASPLVYIQHRTPTPCVPGIQALVLQVQPPTTALSLQSIPKIPSSSLSCKLQFLDIGPSLEPLFCSAVWFVMPCPHPAAVVQNGNGPHFQPRYPTGSLLPPDILQGLGAFALECRHGLLISHMACTPSLPPGRTHPSFEAGSISTRTLVPPQSRKMILPHAGHPNNVEDLLDDRQLVQDL